MSSVHIIVGHLGQDAEIIDLSNGNRKAAISVADKHSWQAGNNEWKEITTWHKVITFQKGLVEKLEKAGGSGRLVWVKGRLQSRSYEKNGQKVQVWETIVDGDGEIRFLDSVKD
ncbi:MULTISPECIES: single-stranded DNA-binding protein [Acetobacter]|uniref:single-stranded DNA-binding protein n=1 Tax=Acetobacter TaxID=434 RepID=UPI0039EA60CF